MRFSSIATAEHQTPGLPDRVHSYRESREPWIAAARRSRDHGHALIVLGRPRANKPIRPLAGHRSAPEPTLGITKQRLWKGACLSSYSPSAKGGDANGSGRQ